MTKEAIHINDNIGHQPNSSPSEKEGNNCNLCLRKKAVSSAVVLFQVSNINYIGWYVIIILNYANQTSQTTNKKGINMLMSFYITRWTTTFHHKLMKKGTCQSSLGIFLVLDESPIHGWSKFVPIRSPGSMNLSSLYLDFGTRQHPFGGWGTILGLLQQSNMWDEGKACCNTHREGCEWRRERGGTRSNDGARQSRSPCNVEGREKERHGEKKLL